MLKRLLMTLIVGSVMLSLLSPIGGASPGLVIQVHLNSQKLHSGDRVFASGNLSNSDWPVQNALIGIFVLDQDGDILLVAVRVSDSDGSFSLDFGLPPTAKSGSYVFTVISDYASMRVSNRTDFLVVSRFGDINGDGVVDIIDAVLVASAFDSQQGMHNYNALADLNLDGIVDFQDISIVVSHLGQQL